MTKIVIPIKSDVIDNNTADFYDFFGMTNYVSPKKVGDQLAKVQTGDTVELQIASNGGDVFAASEIYTQLKSSTAKVSAVIQGLAASAASVIAVAADDVKISPTAQIMIHKAWSTMQGNAEDLAHESQVLNGIDQSIANAYEAKTGMSSGDLLNLMSKETWLGANDAVKYGFADSIMTFSDEKEPEKQQQAMQAFASTSTVVPKAAVAKWQGIMAKMQAYKILDKVKDIPTITQKSDSQQADLKNQKLAILFGKK
ncbi:MAG: Clp protease ClpP [Lactobacillus sp.]|nr:MAG: Clp protease ClpP [Lactobacillus sp.]